MTTVTEPSNWYEEMAKAIKRRENCVAAIERWNEELRKAEATMSQLSQSAPVPPVVHGTAEAQVSGLITGDDLQDPAPSTDENVGA